VTTANLEITEIVEGSGQQSVTVNTALAILDKAITAYYTSGLLQTQNIVLTTIEWQNKFFTFTGTLANNSRTVTVPSKARFFVVFNNTTGGFYFTVKTAAGTGVQVLPGGRIMLTCDGVDVYALTTLGGMSFDVEGSQDAIGAMLDTTLEYVDATPLLRRAALTGNVTAPAGSNVTTIASGVVTEAMQVLADNTTQNVSTTKHGYAPKSPNDGTVFLDGLGAYDTVKDSDLSTSDITTNNVTTAKHGFVPKAPNDATQALDGTGVFSVPTTGQGKHSLWIPAGSILPAMTNGAESSTLEMVTNKNTHRTLTFVDTGAKVYAECDIAFPKKWNKGTITFKVYWTLNSTSTNSAVFGLQGMALSDNDLLDTTYGTAQEVTDAGLGTTIYKTHISAESAAITIGGTPADEDLVHLRFYRDSANASDTLAASVELIGIKLYYTTNANTDV
jgi:hypothetical protein